MDPLFLFTNPIYTKSPVSQHTPDNLEMPQIIWGEITASKRMWIQLFDNKGDF